MPSRSRNSLCTSRSARWSLCEPLATDPETLSAKLLTEGAAWDVSEGLRNLENRARNVFGASGERRSKEGQKAHRQG